jgi:ribosomal protein S1
MIARKQRFYDIAEEVPIESGNRFLELISRFKVPQDRSLTIGIVTRIDKTEGKVWIDIGGKAEGVLSEEEFTLRDFGQQVNVGDRVQVWVQDASSMVDSPESSGSEYSNISFSKAAQIRSWPELEKAYHNRQLVSGIILSKVPGGYVVAFPSNGGRGFLPLSQADPQMARSPEMFQKYKNEQHQYMIIRMERNWYIVLSRRELMLQESGINNTETPAKPYTSAGDKNRNNHRKRS